MLRKNVIDGRAKRREFIMPDRIRYPVASGFEKIIESGSGPE
jgi:hypothetical protein